MFCTQTVVDSLFVLVIRLFLRVPGTITTHVEDFVRPCCSGMFCTQSVVRALFVLVICLFLGVLGALARALAPVMARINNSMGSGESGVFGTQLSTDTLFVFVRCLFLGVFGALARAQAPVATGIPDSIGPGCSGMFRTEFLDGTHTFSMELCLHQTTLLVITACTDPLSCLCCY
jgi:hypothetical protein